MQAADNFPDDAGGVAVLSQFIQTLHDIEDGLT